MFRNWRSIFSGNGAPINPRISIYSFDGRDVLTDPFWYINLVCCLLVCFFASVYVSNSYIYHLLPLLRPQKNIWHGSTSRGLRVVDKHCETWRADDISVMGQSSYLTSGHLLGQQTRSCSNEFIVLCIETHKNR